MPSPSSSPFCTWGQDHTCDDDDDGGGVSMHLTILLRRLVYYTLQRAIETLPAILSFETVPLLVQSFCPSPNHSSTSPAKTIDNFKWTWASGLVVTFSIATTIYLIFRLVLEYLSHQDEVSLQEEPVDPIQDHFSRLSVIVAAGAAVVAAVARPSPSLSPPLL
ncbi:hypothetical protein TWF506_004026 [Arthrobotrys conoides]|uniref:Uncharacterized protein n=1 Tax=Arthrobotrys conoides TaxID=74498 RepID=A0AAN8P4N9_9PEZI